MKRETATEGWLAEVGSRIDRVLEDLIVPLPNITLRIALADEGLPRQAAFGSEELFQPTLPGRYVIASEPGAGKSTYLATEARKYLDEGRGVAYLPMSRHRESGSLTRTLTGAFFDDMALNEYLGQGGLILLDAVDESRADEVGVVFDEILDWATLHREARIICTCRSAELPAWVPKEFQRITLLPLDDDSIKRTLADASTPGTAHLYDLLNSDSLRHLFRNPLLLSMAVAILSDSRLVSARPRIESKVDVYRIFLGWIERREEQRAHLDDRVSRALFRLRPQALGWIGAKMIIRDIVSADRGQMIEWIGELSSQTHLIGSWPTSAIASDLFDMLSAAPPLRETDVSRFAPAQISFMHPSYGEYFAATELLRQASGDGRVPASELAHRIPHATARSFEVMYYAIGQALRPQDLFAAMMTHATENRDRDLLRALAHSLAYFDSFPSSFVDDLIIRAIDAFKFWDKPFDYELFYSTSQISARVSTNFPDRLSRDLHRLERKYANAVPREIPQWSASDVLEHLNAEPDSATLLDIFYTASRIERPGGQKLDIAQAIVMSLTRISGGIDESARAQGVACLAALAEPYTLDYLHDVARDRSAGQLSRVHALNGIGRIGDSRSVPLVVALLRDLTDVYVRDSASWSLQLLGNAARKRSDARTMDVIVATYEWCLSVPPVEEEDINTLGNVLYSIGRLMLTQLTSQVRKVLRTSDSAYVREDAVHTLGQLGAYGAAANIAQCLSDVDPVVRAKAAEALGRLGLRAYRSEIERLRSDDINFVVDCANEALTKLSIDARIAVAFDAARLVDGLYVLHLDLENAHQVDAMANQLFEAGRIRHRVEMIETRHGAELRMTQGTFDAIRATVLGGPL